MGVAIISVMAAWIAVAVAGLRVVSAVPQIYSISQCAWLVVLKPSLPSYRQQTKALAVPVPASDR